eukprot:2550082-Amphidinium_carterae.1
MLLAIRHSGGKRDTWQKLFETRSSLTIVIGHLACNRAKMLGLRNKSDCFKCRSSHFKAAHPIENVNKVVNTHAPPSRTQSRHRSPRHSRCTPVREQLLRTTGKKSTCARWAPGTVLHHTENKSVISSSAQQTLLTVEQLRVCALPSCINRLAVPSDVQKPKVTLKVPCEFHMGTAKVDV